MLYKAKHEVEHEISDVALTPDSSAAPRGLLYPRCLRLTGLPRRRDSSSDESRVTLCAPVFSNGIPITYIRDSEENVYCVHIFENMYIAHQGGQRHFPQFRKFHASNKLRICLLI